MPSVLNGLNRVLQWSDFRTRTMAAPAPGQSGTAAQTWVNYSYRGVNFRQVPGSRPPVGQLDDTVIVDILLVADETWRASWLTSLPQAHQDALLEHERLHYKLSALLYRDLFIEIMYLKPKRYSNANAANNDFNAILSRYTRPIVKAIHDLYDATGQTGHNPVVNANAQQRWQGYAQAAITQRKPLVTILSGAGLQMPNQPASPSPVPIPYPTI
jgi:hypothetical protein